MVKGPGTVIFTCLRGVPLQKQQILDLDRVLAPDLADDARHGIGVARAVERAAGIVDVHALERGGEAVGVALAPDLAVGDDVEARLLLRADGEQRRIVLRLLQEGFGQRATALARARAAGSAPASFLRSISHSGCG